MLNIRDSEIEWHIIAVHGSMKMLQEKGLQQNVPVYIEREV